VTPPWTVLLAFSTALALTAAAVPAVRRVARGGNLYEQPVSDRWHLRPVPKLGGAAMSLAFVATLLAIGTGPGLPLVLLAPLALAVVGMIDDLSPFRPSIKFGAQIAVAAGFLAAAPPIAITGYVPIDLAISLVWFVGITNAFNLLDNIDGLAAGVAAIAGAFLVLSFILDGNPTLLGLGVPVAAMTGVAIGFLLYNWHPASIFMGDGGSHLVGSFFATVTLLAVPHLQGSGTAAIVVILLLVPCADTALVVLTRQLAGRSAFVGGRDHLSHRLVAAGADDRRAVLVLYAIAVLGGLAVIALQTLAPTWGWALVAVYAAGVLGLGVYFSHVDVRDNPRWRSRLPLPTELTSRYRVYEIVLDVLLVALAYYLGLVLRFREPDHFTVFLDHFTRLLPLVALLHIVGLWLGGKYRRPADGSGATAAIAVLRGALLGSAASVVAVLYLTRFQGYSRQAFALAGGFVVIFLWGEILALRSLDELLRRRQRPGGQALICGAGPLGALAIRDLRLNPARGLTPIGVLDDDARRGDRVEGLHVVGRIGDLDDALSAGHVTTVIVATDRLSPERLDEICALAARHAVEVRRFRVSLDRVPPDRREPSSSVVRFPRG
jgi:UDP-GlcNAc:undecaprenyl-phosphate GlcNAc-1-phosphate transferase